jgi:hypothetical protein
MADVQVSYAVDDKTLKSATTGTTFTFDLWSDSACTLTAGTYAVTVDDVDLIERIKRFKPRAGSSHRRLPASRKCFRPPHHRRRCSLP